MLAAELDRVLEVEVPLESVLDVGLALERELAPAFPDAASVSSSLSSLVPVSAGGAFVLVGVGLLCVMTGTAWLNGTMTSPVCTLSLGVWARTVLSVCWINWTRPQPPTLRVEKGVVATK